MYVVYSSCLYFLSILTDQFVKEVVRYPRLDNERKMLTTITKLNMLFLAWAPAGIFPGGGKPLGGGGPKKSVKGGPHIFLDKL